MSFICVCPEKSLQLGSDEQLHRADKEQFVAEFLEASQLGGGPQAKKVSACLSGGGIAISVTGLTPKLVQEGPFLAAVTGSIQNYAYLVKKYLQDDLGLPANVTLEAIKERNPISEPTLLCKMYSMLGTGMLSKLRGHFSFCLYDSTTVRILAARDPSGSIPLTHGYLSNNALYVTSSSYVPPDAGTVLEILPGNYKYGWRAGPRKYTNPESVVKSSAAVASQAALAALSGIAKKSQTANGLAPRRASFDAARVEKKPIEEIRRQSLDHHHKMNSRADEQGWWRSKDGVSVQVEILSKGNSTNGESSKKNQRRNKRSSKSVSSGKSSPEKNASNANQSVIAENFINQLGGAFLEDSASVRMLRSLLCCSPCSLVVTDALDKDNPIVLVNSSFEEQTGYTSAEVVGKNCRFLQTAPSADRVPTLASISIVKALGAGRSVSTRILNYKKDGAAMWNELSVVPLRNADGVVTHHVGMQTFSNASDVVTPMEETSKFMLGKKKNGIMRSRSCSDVMVMASGQVASTVTNLAF